MLKLDSTTLSKSDWDIKLSEDETADNTVSVAGNQIIRWIDKLNGIDNAELKINKLKAKIKKKRKTAKAKNADIIKLYDELQKLMYIPDLVEVVMASNKDYDRANKGFRVNGITYKRLMSTNNGKKKSTIIYINEKIKDIIVSKIENGRNPNQKIVPAKLESYRGLTFSGTTPIEKPNGIIVVKDCITHFVDDIIEIKDIKGEAEPQLSYIDGYEIEHNNSDGFGLMLPSYSKKINQQINNNPDPISGAVIRYAWCKGLLVTFDFIEFAENVAGSYEVIDVWGHKRDVREADVILTESMLKLWESYDSWEDYEKISIANSYDFGVTKTCPMELDKVRETNYQFLNPFDLTDEEIKDLCKPTITEIQEIKALDYRKSILYLAGENLDTESFDKIDDNIVKALMIEPTMINDPYIRRRINRQIEKRIERAALGKLTISGNFAIISGDPYALCQSMFNLPITGLLSAGEVYHNHWKKLDKEKIACFRAPMSVINNVKVMTISTSEQAAYWYQYIKTVCILNAFDTLAEAENGADFDGDLLFTTDNKILIDNTPKSRTIISVQNKAEKKIPTEKDIVKSDKLAFDDKTGEITNTVTEMYDLLKRFNPDSEEYKTLQYRIRCGQHHQQGQIDKCKGAAVKPMPEYWQKLKKGKEYTDLQEATCANKQPYFFIYNYPETKTKYETIKANREKNCRREKRMEIADFEKQNTAESRLWIEQTENELNVTDYGCTVNRISHYVENQMTDFDKSLHLSFDYNILKSDVIYTTAHYNRIAQIYSAYSRIEQIFMRVAKTNKMDKEEVFEKQKTISERFRAKCDRVCRADELVNIVLDLVYIDKKLSKNFAWEICGADIVENLMKRNNYKYSVPIRDENGEFEYRGERYTMLKMGKEHYYENAYAA